jgi:hypothetical protein
MAKFYGCDPETLARTWTPEILEFWHEVTETVIGDLNKAQARG